MADLVMVTQGKREKKDTEAARRAISPQTPPLTL